MPEIKVERQAPESTLDKLGVRAWPIWTKELSIFPWTYDSHETCYFLEGEVVVVPEGGTPIHVSKGDLVTFPPDMSYTWDIRQAVRKYYLFGEVLLCKSQ